MERDHRHRPKARRNLPGRAGAGNVFTETLVKDAGIYRPAAFIQMVPNMDVVETQKRATLRRRRGISGAKQRTLRRRAVDGVLETNPAEFNQELFDVQQIEVLKGPQVRSTGATPSAAPSSSRPLRPPTSRERRSGRLRQRDSMRGQLGVSGPLATAPATGFRITTSPTDSRQRVLGEKADPVEDLSARCASCSQPERQFQGRRSPGHG